jgi:integrase
MAAGGHSMTTLKRDLTDRAIRAFKPAASGKRYIESDAQVSGFGVRVTDKGHKSFVLVTRYPGATQPAPRAIGDYPTMDLAEARRIAREWRDDIAKGIDPKDKAEAVRHNAEAARREADRRRANTFRTAFEAYAKEHLAALRTGAIVAGVIEKHVMPVLGDRPLAEITRADANELLRAIARQTPTHSLRIKSYLSRFGRWAEDDERVAESPFARLRRFAKEQPRDRILRSPEIRAIWRACDRMGVFGRAVRVMLATGQRRSEVGDMEWREVDHERKVWVIPKERTKASRAHAVPLSPLPLSILADCPRLGAHVFTTRNASRDGGTIPISGWSKAKTRLGAFAVEALREMTGDSEAMIPEWRLHDLRRTAASLMTESGVSRLVVSKVLNHAEQGVTGKHYDLFEYLPQKTQALNLWGRRLAAIVEGREDPDNVVALEAARGQ